MRDVPGCGTLLAALTGFIPLRCGCVHDSHAAMLSSARAAGSSIRLVPHGARSEAQQSEPQGSLQPCVTRTVSGCAGVCGWGDSKWVLRPSFPGDQHVIYGTLTA